jgi:hypothetical protein
MKSSQAQRLILGFPQVAFRQVVRKQWRVVEDFVSNPSKWPRERVEDTREEASELHVVVDIIDTLLLIQLEACGDRSFVAEVNAVEIFGQLVAVLNGHAHPVRHIWRDRVNGIADAEDPAFRPLRSVVDFPAVYLSVKVGGIQEARHRLCPVFENIREVAFHVRRNRFVLPRWLNNPSFEAGLAIVYHGKEACLMLPVVRDEAVLWWNVRDELAPGKVQPDTSVEERCGSKGLLRYSRAYAVSTNKGVTHHRLSVCESDLDGVFKLGVFDKLMTCLDDTFRHEIEHLLESNGSKHSIMPAIDAHLLVDIGVERELHPCGSVFVLEVRDGLRPEVVHACPVRAQDCQKGD